MKDGDTGASGLRPQHCGEDWGGSVHRQKKGIWRKRWKKMGKMGIGIVYLKK